MLKDKTLTKFETEDFIGQDSFSTTLNTRGFEKRKIIEYFIDIILFLKMFLKSLLKKTENEIDGTQRYLVTIQSVPSPLFVQWSSKGTDEDMYKPVDVNEKDYKGTLNTLPHPVLVLEKNKLQNYHYQVEVVNFIGCSVKQISGIIIARYC